jgi:hypothetical protein
MLEKREVIIPVDGELIKQLSSRRLQYDARARIQLEPKDSLRARGLPSPDRAEAAIGAAVIVYRDPYSKCVTAETLSGIMFGGNGQALFDFEPVTFE